MCVPLPVATLVLLSGLLETAATVSMTAESAAAVSTVVSLSVVFMLLDELGVFSYFGVLQYGW